MNKKSLLLSTGGAIILIGGIVAMHQISLVDVAGSSNKAPVSTSADSKAMATGSMPQVALVAPGTTQVSDPRLAPVLARTHSDPHELAVVNQIRSSPTWKKTERSLILHFSLKFADFINGLKQSDAVKEQVHAIIAERYLPHTTAEIQALDSALTELIGPEGYAAFQDYQQELSQRTTDEAFATEYLAAQPNASSAEIGALADVISQLQGSGPMIALSRQPSITQTDIDALTANADAAFAKAIANSSLSPAAIIALRKIYDAHRAEMLMMLHLKVK